MWQGYGHAHRNGKSVKKVTGNEVVALAIARDKASQHALRWAIDNLLSKGKAIILIHVFQDTYPTSAMRHLRSDTGNGNSSPRRQQLEKLTKDLFLTFHCYCTRKDVGSNIILVILAKTDYIQTRNLHVLFIVTYHIQLKITVGVEKDTLDPYFRLRIMNQLLSHSNLLDQIHCFDVILEDMDVAKALAEYVSYAAIEHLILGTSARPALIRFKTSHIPSNVSKGTPDFCTVYVISKGKVTSVRNASRAVPHESPLMDQIENLKKQNSGFERLITKGLRERQSKKPLIPDESTKSPVVRLRGVADYMSDYSSEINSDISFVSSGRPSSDRTSCIMPYDIDEVDLSHCSSSPDSISTHLHYRFNDLSPLHGLSSFSPRSGRTSTSYSSQTLDDMEAEMRSLKLELKQTMDMYNTACREALTAKEKTVELQHWRLEEERRLEEARHAQEAAAAIAEMERTKSKAATEAAEAARRIAELEAQRRLKVEVKALKNAEEMRKVLDALNHSDFRYRRYTIDEIETATEYFAKSHKIGEGGYGPVFRCYLDHTPVAVKVLRPDAAEGRAQFQQEVEVLSRIRHPNMVLLLGACPEYGCIVYEYMANGSLENLLFRKGSSHVPVLSWRLRFRIAAEIATALSFLHHTKPEPLVHRDLKPANVLLDSNYVSKISDVGLARLVPPSVAENITQYRLTSAAGTFCYIDPEYQQTGMLGVKSDVYSFGILLLQLITAKPAMGITHHVDMAIERGNFSEILDPDVSDWPVDKALQLATIGLQCAEMRRKDRPDLGTVVVPELSRLRSFAEADTNDVLLGTSPFVSGAQDVLSVHSAANSESSNANSNASISTVS